MRKRLSPQLTLLDPQDAITVYLDALLCEVAFADEVPSANSGETEKAAVLFVPPVPAEREEIVEEAMVEEPPPAPIITEIQPERKTYAWAQGRFQCLSFQVAGLTLAAPLEKLHGIVKWDATITALPGYAPWFMGLLQNRGRNVQVVDTAQIVMTDGRRPDMREANERVQFVVLIDGGRWGLAVDKIAEVVTLEPEAVRWSSANGKRPWLAGTVIERMCALLDMDSLCAQLQLTRK
jgi:purine-binding chemotaxis protein CheW